MTVDEKRAVFRTLHKDGCFVLPNPWDAGSAKLLQHLGFKALASSSAGCAWTLGKPDHLVTRDEIVARLAALCAAVDLPVNADFESGFAGDPEGVAASVTLALDAGVAGLSIEDLAGFSPTRCCGAVCRLDFWRDGVSWTIARFRCAEPEQTPRSRTQLGR